jgi:hypothetical protein
MRKDIEFGRVTCLVYGLLYPLPRRHWMTYHWSLALVDGSPSIARTQYHRVPICPLLSKAWVSEWKSKLLSNLQVAAPCCYRACFPWHFTAILQQGVDVPNRLS